MNPVLQCIETLTLILWCGLLALPLGQVWIAYSLETDSVQTTWSWPHRRRACAVVARWCPGWLGGGLQRNPA